MTRPALHEQEDHALRLGGEVRPLRREWVGLRRAGGVSPPSFVGQERREGEGAEPAAGEAEEVAAGAERGNVRCTGSHESTSTSSLSSRCQTTLPTTLPTASPTTSPTSHKRPDHTLNQTETRSYGTPAAEHARESSLRTRSPKTSGASTPQTNPAIANQCMNRPRPQRAGALRTRATSSP